VKKKNKTGKPNNLKNIRTKEGLSRAALARESELTEQTVRRVEKGQPSTAPTRHRLLMALNTLAKNGQHTYKQVFPNDPEVD